MNPQLLIQDIVRQTTVLIAQISTAAGLRAPLAHVANQVFLDLARELEAQGVRRNVVADMFGLALRSYQLKVQRAMDAASAQRSLWGDVFEVLGEGAMSRQAIEERFPRVEGKALSAVLNDLVDSGLAYRSGRGRSALHGLVPREDAQRLAQEDGEFAAAHYLWLHLATRGASSEAALGEAVGLEQASIRRATGELVRQGIVRRRDDGMLEALGFDIPVGSARGWEAAVCDHFRAMAQAVAAKLESPQSHLDDRIGGTTLRFTVYEGHPQAGRVFGLLSRLRHELNELWEQTHAYNREHALPEDATRVTFYFGQNVGPFNGGESSEVEGAADDPAVTSVDEQRVGRDPSPED